MNLIKGKHRRHGSSAGDGTEIRSARRRGNPAGGR